MAAVVTGLLHGCCCPQLETDRIPLPGKPEDLVVVLNHQLAGNNALTVAGFTKIGVEGELRESSRFTIDLSADIGKILAALGVPAPVQGKVTAAFARESSGVYTNPSYYVPQCNLSVFDALESTRDGASVEGILIQRMIGYESIATTTSMTIDFKTSLSLSVAAAVKEVAAAPPAELSPADQAALQQAATKDPETAAAGEMGALTAKYQSFIQRSFRNAVEEAELDCRTVLRSKRAWVAPNEDLDGSGLLPVGQARFTNLTVPQESNARLGFPGVLPIYQYNAKARRLDKVETPERFEVKEGTRLVIVRPGARLQSSKVYAVLQVDRVDRQKGDVQMALYAIDLQDHIDRGLIQLVWGDWIDWEQTKELLIQDLSDLLFEMKGPSSDNLRRRARLIAERVHAAQRSSKAELSARERRKLGQALDAVLAWVDAPRSESKARLEVFEAAVAHFEDPKIPPAFIVGPEGLRLGHGKSVTAIEEGGLPPGATVRLRMKGHVQMGYPWPDGIADKDRTYSAKIFLAGNLMFERVNFRESTGGWECEGEAQVTVDASGTLRVMLEAHGTWINTGNYVGLNFGPGFTVQVVAITD